MSRLNCLVMWLWYGPQLVLGLAAMTLAFPFLVLWSFFDAESPSEITAAFDRWSLEKEEEIKSAIGRLGKKP
ncbi:MAG TPA: hypothetical protein PLN42_04645 [Anaerolineae bacterium]|nr:hypothetical protein [Anaerolineae bacterium]